MLIRPPRGSRVSSSGGPERAAPAMALDERGAAASRSARCRAPRSTAPPARPARRGTAAASRAGCARRRGGRPARTGSRRRSGCTRSGRGPPPRSTVAGSGADVPLVPQGGRQDVGVADQQRHRASAARPPPRVPVARQVELLAAPRGARPPGRSPTQSGRTRAPRGSRAAGQRLGQGRGAGRLGAETTTRGRPGPHRRGSSASARPRSARTAVPETGVDTGPGRPAPSARRAAGPAPPVGVGGEDRVDRLREAGRGSSMCASHAAGSSKSTGRRRRSRRPRGASGAPRASRPRGRRAGSSSTRGAEQLDRHPVARRSAVPDERLVAGVQRIELAQDQAVPLKRVLRHPRAPAGSWCVESPGGARPAAATGRRRTGR